MLTADSISAVCNHMETVNILGHQIKVTILNTAIVGAGAAGFAAAVRLFDFGQQNIAIICEDMRLSTSRNTGSDKQTYYKLTLSGEECDSVRLMAKSLFEGGCVDGDIALAEAALSAPCFLKLADMGVPFPMNRYGEYIGYKTDHDPMRRATSAGPLTSKMMTECLESAVKEKGIQVFENYQVIRIITKNGGISGLLCLSLDHSLSQAEYLLIHCINVIYATGGPAGMYADSVYPVCQYGSSGIAFEAGVKGRNLTEWQFGLASLDPRWNVSGSYMQVLPSIYSVDSNGKDQCTFLRDHFRNDADYLNSIFYKGYEWPFDVRKIGGSSIIDLLVYTEVCIKGRRVFIDFSQNPFEPMDYSLLDDAAAAYLSQTGAMFGNPVQRLIRMNQPAYELYFGKGIDLKKQPLEIALCVQHNNGGLAVDCWWQTNIEGFFAVGEAAGTHGVYRPGGAALNAGQVGAVRAALYISGKRKGLPPNTLEFIISAQEQVEETLKLADSAKSDKDNVVGVFVDIRKRMSNAGAAVRQKEQLTILRDEVKGLLERFSDEVKTSSISSLSLLYKLRDTLISQYVYLSAMINYIDRGGNSRGSALYPDEKGDGIVVLPHFTFSYTGEQRSLNDMIQEVNVHEGECYFCWRPVRVVPDNKNVFENEWRTYRENGNIY